MSPAQTEYQETTVQNGNVTESSRQLNDPQAAKDHKKDVASRVVWFIAGVILALLALRFLLALLGANPANGFANFIYTVTYPLVAPFFNLFRYDFTAGATRFEAFTLVAMLVYSLIAYGIARLVTITRR